MKTRGQLARREDQAAQRIEQQEGELMRIRAASRKALPNLASAVCSSRGASVSLRV